MNCHLSMFMATGNTSALLQKVYWRIWTHCRVCRATAQAIDCGLGLFFSEEFWS